MPACVRALAVLLAALLVGGCADSTVEEAPPDGGGLGHVEVGVDASGPGDVGSGAGRGGDAEPDGGAADAGAELPASIRLRVTLDGEPAAGARVTYGGSGVFAETSTDGWAEVALRPRVPGNETTIIVAHPEARTGHMPLTPGAPLPESIALERYDPSDNPAYRFADPGEPDRRATTAQCAHCHVTLNADWLESAHRTSASSPIVLDVYTGAVSAAADEASCRSRGGAWVASTVPGSGATAPRCHLGDGVLDVLNPGCAGPPCEGPELGACAACHAPGIDGATTGRGLLEARGRAFAYGVHCDVCHRVESVHLGAGPGVAGALRILRPSERGPIGLGEDGWLPLTFGPSWDSPNPRMGSVPRAHFRGPELCAGCHEYAQAVLVDGTAIDRARWPGGRLPVLSTLTEWQRSPYRDSVSCQGCHMPPDPAAENGADLQLLSDASIGVAGGWPRPPGAVRSHAFVGPRTEGAGLLEMAAALYVEDEVQGQIYEVRVTTENVGAGHAFPTGEPSRQAFLVVEARCGAEALAAVGGDAIGPLGGFSRWREGPFTPEGWPEAIEGDRLHALVDGGFVDYDGPAPFEAGGRLRPEEKGRRRWLVAGAATVVAVDGGRVTLDRALPEADAVARNRPSADGPPMLAGEPGTSFARVMVGADGALAVPHHAAVDIARDDRLPARGSRATVHRFLLPAGCGGPPTAEARLVYRAFPRDQIVRRSWDRPDRVIAEGRP